MQTVSQLAAFSLRQDGALAACDATRAGLVDMIDGLNAAVAPKRPWWKVWQSKGR